MDYGGAHNSHLKAKSTASKQKQVKFKIQRGPAENQDSTDTLSPSSSNSSSDDYFQVHPKILPKLRVQINNKPPPSTDPLKLPFHKNDNIDLSSKALYRFEESINVGSPGSTPRPRFSDITYEPSMPQFSLTQSPPMQLMDKIGDFDPTRIPQAVFSKSSTPADWSTASNDSLFSIRIGDGSFSRDRASSEVLKPKELSVKGELIRIGPTPSPNSKGIEPYFDIEETISANPEEILILDERIGDGPNMGPLNNNHVHAEKRDNRVQHFVKPKKKKSLWLPCHCGGCCWASLCGCKWPSCSSNWCFWPSCSGICSSFHCKCPELSSCCCKCPKLSSCCCKCPELSSCCCKFPNWSSCCCKCSLWSCCKCSSWSCCKCSLWSCCKCSSWSCCKCSSWSCCKCSSWSFCKSSSWSWSSCCCKCSLWSFCKCSSWSCCKCSSWSCCESSSWSCFKCSSCCKCRCLNCMWACCCCWDHERKTDSYGFPTKLTDGGTTISKSSTKALSQGKSSCFSCSSSCC